MKNNKSITSNTPFKKIKKPLDNVNIKNKVYNTQINLTDNNKLFNKSNIKSNISPARNPIKKNEDIKKNYYMDNNDLNKKEELINSKEISNNFKNIPRNVKNNEIQRFKRKRFRRKRYVK
jgi:hypothetical protein